MNNHCLEIGEHESGHERRGRAREDYDPMWESDNEGSYLDEFAQQDMHYERVPRADKNWDHDIKIVVGDFEGCLQPYAFLDWVDWVDQYFEWKAVL